MSFFILARKTDEDRMWFQGVVEPPPEVLQKILQSPTCISGLQIYKNWIKEKYSGLDTEVYETGVGYTDNGSEVGFPHQTSSYNFGEEHIKQLNDWLKYIYKEGYTLEIGE